MTEGPWIFIRPERLESLSAGIETVEVRGVRLDVGISPYDLPKAFRGGYDAGRGVFRLEFKYSDDERPRAKRLDKCVSLQLGRHSDKLLAIDVAVDRHGINVVQVDLVKQAASRAEEAISTLQSRKPRINAKLNYAAAGELIRDIEADPNQLVASGS